MKNQMTYAVYPSDDGSLYFAVCLSDPFLYASAVTRDEAVEKLTKLIRIKYGTLQDVVVPDYLPEDF